jgi:hypothetical protein
VTAELQDYETMVAEALAFPKLADKQTHPEQKKNSWAKHNKEKDEPNDTAFASHLIKKPQKNLSAIG